jgi:hypothetical protein
MNRAENFTANIFDSAKAQYVTQYDGVIYQIQVPMQVPTYLWMLFHDLVSYYAEEANFIYF